MAEPPPAESQSESVSSEAAPSIQKPPEVTVEDDSDPDFDDLDGTRQILKYIHSPRR